MISSKSIRDYLSPHLVTLTPEMDVMEAISLLGQKDVPGAPVVDQIGNLVGILAEKDCLSAALNAAYHNEPGGRVEELMAMDVETVEVDTSLADVAERFIASGHRGMPVLDDTRLVGMINRSDILRALVQFLHP